MNYCEICKIGCSGIDQYQQHIDGAKHKKKATEIAAFRAGLQLSKCDTESKVNVCGSNMLSENNSQGIEMDCKSYFCKVCKVECSGYFPYEQHLKGKSHLKNVNLQVRVQQSFPLLSSFAEKPRIKDELDIPCESLEKKMKTTNEPTVMHSAESVYNFCDICKVPCTGFVQYQQHIKGKSHLKQVKMNEAQQKNAVNKNDSEPSASSSSLISDFSTVSLSSLKLVSVAESSKSSVEKLLSDVEEQGYESYFCKICPTQCSGYFPYDQHLKGEKHRKRKSIYFHQLCRNKNSATDNDVEMIDVDDSTGTSNDSEKSSERTNEKKKDQSFDSSKSRKNIEDEMEDVVGDTFVKNMVCSLCDAKCNSSFMVQQHIAGEKHKKKVLAWKLHRTSETEVAAKSSFPDCKPGSSSFNLANENKVSASTSLSVLSNETMPIKSDTFHIDVSRETDSPSNNQSAANLASVYKQLTDNFKIGIIGPDEEIHF